MSLRSLLDLPVDMGWRHVLFANWPVDPAVVQAHLPASLTVDTYEDDTVRIQAKHHIPPDGEEILYYHSDDQTVRYAVQLEGGLKEERVVADLSVPDGDTTA